jgi:hypothetical protein
MIRTQFSTCQLPLPFNTIAFGLYLKIISEGHQQLAIISCRGNFLCLPCTTFKALLPPACLTSVCPLATWPLTAQFLGPAAEPPACSVLSLGILAIMFSIIPAVYTFAQSSRLISNICLLDFSHFKFNIPQSGITAYLLNVLTTIHLAVRFWNLGVLDFSLSCISHF